MSEIQGLNLSDDRLREELGEPFGQLVEALEAQESWTISNPDIESALTIWANSLNDSAGVLKALDNTDDVLRILGFHRLTLSIKVLHGMSSHVPDVPARLAIAAMQILRSKDADPRIGVIFFERARALLCSEVARRMFAPERLLSISSALDEIRREAGEPVSCD